MSPTLDHPAHSLVTILTELSWLFTGSSNNVICFVYYNGVGGEFLNAI